MDERVGVDHLESSAEFSSRLIQRLAAGNHASGFEAQDRAQALAARKRAVAHRAVDGVWRSVGRGKQALECLVGEYSAGLKESLNVELHRKWMIVDTVDMLQESEIACGWGLFGVE